MPAIKPVSFTTPGYDYAADEAEIKRRQMMADLLQKQSMEPIDPTRQAGGWTIPISPWEGLAKIGKGAASGINAARAERMQRELARRIQGEGASAMTDAMGMLRDQPAQTLQPSAMGGDQASETGIANIPARPADPMGALVAASRNPMAAQLVGPMAMQAIQEQRLKAMVDQLSNRSAVPPGTPGMSPATSQNAFGTPEFANGPQGSNPLEGLNPNALPFMTSTIPGASEIGKALQSSYMERTKPQNVRPQGTIAVPDGRGGYRQAYYSAPVGEGMTRNAEGVASLTPGYLEGQAALGKTPLEKVQNEDQTYSYIPRAQLAGAAMASPIPQAPPQPIPNAPQPRPSPANFPRETPDQRARGWEGRARTLNAELAQEQQRAAAATTPEDRQQAQENIAAIQKELGGVPRGAAVGPPKFGQTQKQVVEQARQTAAGKAVDEAFAKEYVAFTTGGAQDTAKQISQLKDVQSELGTKGANLTGPMVGSTPDFALNWVNPKSVAMKERVQEVVQRSLRAILGAQFTENEGERLIARAYNPKQPESENLIRVNRLATQLEQAFKMKQDAAQYFEKNGTLQGWQGKLPSISDFDPEVNRSSGVVGQQEGARNKSKSGRPMTFRNGRWEYD